MTSSHAGVATGGAIELAWAELLFKVGTKLCTWSHGAGSAAFPLSSVPSRSPVQGRLPVQPGSMMQDLRDERARLARELHAGAGQPLSGIQLNLAILQEAAEELPERAREAIGRLERLTEQALEQLRAVSHRLHPPAWQQLPVRQAMLNLIETSGIGARFLVDVSVQEPPTEPDHRIKISLYRCLQECLSNIIRHSDARSVTIALEQRHDKIGLTVSDDGRGFPAKEPSGGIGVRALREHAAEGGGECNIRSGPGGTVVDILMPLVEME